MRIVLASSLFLSLVSPIASASSATIEFSAPAEIEGRSVRASVESESFLAFYQTGAEPDARLEFNGRSSAARILYCSQDYVRMPPDPGYLESPAAERRTEPLPDEVISLRLVRALPNFTLVVQLPARSSIELANGSLGSPLTRTHLIAASHGRGLEPKREPTEWTPNFVNLEVQGPFHHYSVPVAALSSTGEFRIWISHAIVEIRNGTETRRLDLSAHVERHFDVPGVGPLHARYNATMFEGRFRGQLDLSLAGLGHLLAPSLELHDVTHLGAPLSNATVHGTPPEFVTRRESRLDVFGRFDLALLDANHHEGGDASSDQRLWGRLDGRIDNLLIDRHARVVMGGALPTMVAGTFFVALAVAVFVVLRRTMASVLAWSAGASWPSVIVASSKIAPQHVLDHPTRRHLLTLLETRYAMTRVGTFVVEAAQTLGMGRFNVQYHLRMMHRAKVIELVRMPGNTSLYVAPNHGFMSDERTRMLAALLNHEIGRAVAEALATSPGASQAAIIRDALARLGPRAPTRMAVHKWVRRFDQQNLVRREQRGHRVLYHPSPFLHEFVHALKSAGNVAKAIPTLGRRAET